MKKIILIKELEKYPVFTLGTLRRITRKERNYAKLILHRLKEEGLIFKIERNKYTVHEDPILIASNIIWPSYMSFWNALRYHNLTEQLPQNIFVLTSRARKNRKIEFMGTEIFFIKVKSRYFFGFRKEPYHNFNIFVAEPEKALVDSALFKRMSFSEISEIIRENPDVLSPEKIIQYSLKTGNTALIKRFGFLLETLGEDFFNDAGNLTSNYIPLDYTMPGEGKKNKKWRIIENAGL
ncbi:MAG: hypothetical protein A7316_08735 [Candidatus Altiarchaeales archaeon WOR_SM1_86-2]|nr:MAG: hypothetical protein A7316_08735 [Candidatus Altiarchaeales archaeon WOR_SM1_86-2]